MAASDQGASDVRWAVEHSTPVLGLIGLVVYGVVRLGIDAFYSRLGVTAEEVGLTYGAILSRAAIGLLVALVGLLALGTVSTIQFAAGYYFARTSVELKLTERDRQLVSEAEARGEAPPRYANRQTRLEARQIAPFWFVIALISLPSALITAIAWTSTSADLQALGLDERAPFLILSVYSLVGVAIAWAYGIRANRPARMDKSTWPGTRAKIATAVVSLIIFASSLLVSNWAGDHAAKEVEAGRPIARSEEFSVSWIFDIEATCVELTPVKESSATTAGEPALGALTSPTLFLGRSGDTVILYSKDGGPIRVAGTAYVIIGTDDSACSSR